MKQMDEIDRLNEDLDGLTILKGIEVEILEDGSLDLPDSVLGKLDLVVGTIHNQLRLPLGKQTERILRGMDHPHFTFLAHPSGRLINEREPMEVDIPRVINKARERGCFLELNANIRRLDLYDTYCQMAKAQGVLIAINSDAHNINALDHLRFGVGQARRGWLEKERCPQHPTTEGITEASQADDVGSAWRMGHEGKGRAQSARGMAHPPSSRL